MNTSAPPQTRLAFSVPGQCAPPQKPPHVRQKNSRSTIFLSQLTASRRWVRRCLGTSFWVSATLASIGGFSLAHAGLAVFVSPTGEDNNDGSLQAPVQSLTRARDVVRQKKLAGALNQGDLTVWLAGGYYEQATSFRLTEADSGQPGARIVWRPLDGQSVHVTGDRQIPAEAFHPLSQPEIRQRLGPEAAAHVVVADLRALGISDFGRHRQFGHSISVEPAPLELFYQGTPMPLARYPNRGSLLIGVVVDPGSIPRTGDYSERGGTFTYTDNRHERWVGLEDVWLQGTFHYGFADDFLRVASIQPDSRKVRLAQPHLYGLASGKPFQHYVAMNILDELDEPGEWYLNRDASLLYFWPPAGLTNASIRVSMLADPIVWLSGASHVTIRGMTIENGRGIGVCLERGASNLVAGCTIRNVGTSGVFMGQGAEQTFPHITVDDYEGRPVSGRVGSLQNHLYRHTAWERQAGQGHRIISCEIYQTGSGGVALSGGSKRFLVPGNNAVENCRIHDFNRRNRFCWAGVNIDGCGNRVAHCEIYNSDCQGIYVHGNDHVFEFNDIHHVTLESDDTSPWYLGRDPSDCGNVVRHNYFHDCGNVDRMNMGIYCDDSTTSVLVHGNVFFRMRMTHGVLFSNSGWDIVMTNNVIVDPLAATFEISAHYYTWAANEAVDMFGEKGLLRRRLLEAVNVLAPPYRDRYPNLARYLDPISPNREWEGMRARRNLLAGNVIVRGGPEPVRRLGGPYAQCESSRNFITDHDPGFVNMSEGNFGLRPDAEAFARIPGFQPVLFDRMGPQPDEFVRSTTHHSP